MQLIGGYILRQIATKSAAAILIMLSAFVLERTLRLIRDVGLSALSPDLALGLLLCRIPEILAICIAPAFFAGVLLTFQQLHRDSELDAIYASGVGLVHMARPLLLLIGGVAAVSIILLWFLFPHSKYYFRVLMNEATLSAFTAPFKQGLFVQFDGNVIYIASGEDRAGELGRIFFYETGGNGEKFATTAASAELGLSEDGRNLFLSARDGRRVSVPGFGREPTLLTFDQARKLIYAFDRRKIPDRGDYVSELTLRELAAALKNEPDESRELQLQARLHSRLARVLQVLLLPLAAVPLALCFPASRHWMAIAIGAALVLALDQGLIIGETAVGRGKVSPILGVWGVLACFAAIAGLLTVFAARRGRSTAR